MPHMMVQAVFRYFTDLPKDVAVNTFHFDTPGVDVLDEAMEVASHVEMFYNSPVGSPQGAVSEFLSAVITRASGHMLTKVYDMSQPRPRVPVWETDWTMAPPTSTQSLPLEVAICNSFAAEPTPGVSMARRRGRIFLGPLHATVVQGGSTSTFPQIAETVRSRITAASQRLAVNSRASDTPWCVYSRILGELSPVVRGWVDNEPDTQRRRQPTPTSRVSWTLSI